MRKSSVYEIELRRWPEESGKTMTEGYRANKELGALPIGKAQLLIADHDKAIEVKAGATVAKFTVDLKKGKTKLIANFLDKSGEIICGSPYVKVTRKQDQNL